MKIKKIIYSFIAMGCLTSMQGYSLGGGPPVHVGIRPRANTGQNVPSPGVHPTAPAVQEAARKRNEPVKTEAPIREEVGGPVQEDIGAP